MNNNTFKDNSPKLAIVLISISAILIFTVYPYKSKNNKPSDDIMVDSIGRYKLERRCIKTTEVYYMFVNDNGLIESRARFDCIKYRDEKVYLPKKHPLIK